MSKRSLKFFFCLFRLCSQSGNQPAAVRSISYKLYTGTINMAISCSTPTTTATTTTTTTTKNKGAGASYVSKMSLISMFTLSALIAASVRFGQWL